MKKKASKLMHYLWKDKKGVYYITDYDEKKGGKQKIDGHGWIEVELVYSDPSKQKVITHAQVHFLNTFRP